MNSNVNIRVVYFFVTTEKSVVGHFTRMGFEQSKLKSPETFIYGIFT